MAERRMFSKQIVDSDDFLDMPLSTQALYFHLAMRADDDGFINNVKKIIRMIGSNDNEFETLLTNNFVILFDGGVCVIKHWLIHNYIQKDRYKSTSYMYEKSLLEIAENRMYTECIQNVSSLDTQVRLGKVRLELGKVRLGEDSQDKKTLLPKKRQPPKANPDEENALQNACRETWNAYGSAYHEKYGTDPIRNAMINKFIKNFVTRIGYEEAPQVAGWYLTHTDGFYNKCGHSVQLLAKDAEKLRMEWATGRNLTGIKSRQQEASDGMQQSINEIARKRGYTS